MPLITICGLPVVGKSTFASRLASSLQSKSPSTSVLVINEGVCTNKKNKVSWIHHLHSENSIHRSTIYQKVHRVFRLSEGKGHSIVTQKCRRALSYWGYNCYPRFYELHKGELLSNWATFYMRWIADLSYAYFCDRAIVMKSFASLGLSVHHAVQC